MQARPINRRRALTIIAAAGAYPAAAKARGQTQSITWRGYVLGAEASMTFYGTSRDRAGHAVNLCLAEIARLENIFSLYRAHSEISELNRRGRIASPSQDMRKLLTLSQHIGRLTAGAFDPTVQRLWQLNADWLAANPSAENGPPAKELTRTHRLVDYRRIRIENTSIQLGAGQQITLNGIAQGYITDQVAELLRTEGWKNILLNLGEYRALQDKPDGTPFQIDLAGSTETIALSDMALASSAGTGFAFPWHSQRHTHIFDPKTALSPHNWKAIHVRHPSAAMADGLSTAFSAMSAGDIARAVSTFPATTLWAQPIDGAMLQRHQASAG